MDLVADDEEAYIELAVRLGRDAEWRRSVRAELAQVRDALFDDPDELVDFEDALAQACS
jgi:predicted O-linked N-acetylglucosamine transferase (SPINDLY family)